MVIGAGPALSPYHGDTLLTSHCGASPFSSDINPSLGGVTDLPVVVDPAHVGGGGTPAVPAVALPVHTLVVVVAPGVGLEGEVAVVAVPQLAVAPGLVVEGRVRLGRAPG